MTETYQFKDSAQQMIGCEQCSSFSLCGKEKSRECGEDWKIMKRRAHKEKSKKGISREERAPCYNKLTISQVCGRQALGNHGTQSLLEANGWSQKLRRGASRREGELESVRSVGSIKGT